MKIFIILVTFWLILSGYIEPFFLLCGVISSLLSLFLTMRLKNNANLTGCIYLTTNRKFISLLFNSFCYIFWLVYQIILANIYLVKKVWQLNLTLKPVFYLMKTGQKSEFNTFLLTNSITLTPGTVSVDVLGDLYKEVRVLALDKELIEGLSVADDKVTDVFCKKNI